MIRLILSPGDWYDKNLAAQEKCEALYWKIHFWGQIENSNQSCDIHGDLIEVCGALELVEIDVSDFADVQSSRLLSSSDARIVKTELKRICGVLRKRLNIAKVFSFLRYAIPVIAVLASGLLVKHSNPLGSAQAQVTFPENAYTCDGDELILSEEYQAEFINDFGDYFFEGKRYPRMYVRGSSEATHKFKFIVNNESTIKSAFVSNIFVSVKRVGGNSFPYKQLDCEPDIEATAWYKSFGVKSKNHRPIKNLELDVLVDDSLVTTFEKDFLDAGPRSKEIFRYPTGSITEFPYYEIEIAEYLEVCRRDSQYKIELFNPVTEDTSYVRTAFEAAGKLQAPKEITYRFSYEDIQSRPYQYEPLTSVLLDGGGGRRVWLSRVNWRVSLIYTGDYQEETEVRGILDSDSDGVGRYLDEMMPLAERFLERSGQNPFDAKKGVDLIIKSMAVDLNNGVGKASEQVDMYLNADGLLVGYTEFGFKSSGIYEIEFQVNEETCFHSEVEILTPEQPFFKYPESLKLFTDSIGEQ